MCWTVVSEIAPTPGHVASIGGIQNFAGNLAGILITTFTGVMLALTSGSFLIPLAVAGGAVPGGGAVLSVPGGQGGAAGSALKPPIVMAHHPDPTRSEAGV